MASLALNSSLTLLPRPPVFHPLFTHQTPPNSTEENEPNHSTLPSLRLALPVRRSEAEESDPPWSVQNVDHRAQRRFFASPPVEEAEARTTTLNSDLPSPTPSPASRSQLSFPTVTAAPRSSRTATDLPLDLDVVARRNLEKRWSGWDTTTYTSYVTNTQDVPKAITVYTTFGESPNVDGGTTTETYYKGADTITVAGPSYLTITFYPTSTTYHTTRTTVPTTTVTKTSTPVAVATQLICKPGDADVKERTGLSPTHDNSITLYVIAIYIVGIGIAWNLVFVRTALYGLKCLAVAQHEFGHILSCVLLSISIRAIVIDPEQGGYTTMDRAEGALDEKDPGLPLPFGALPLGYLCNIIIGGIYTFCGFDTLASKIASFMIGFSLFALIFWTSGLGKVTTVLSLGLMIGLWWADHAWGLRFFVLFVGVMNSFYILWDVLDDIIFHKENSCCAVQMSDAMPVLAPMMFVVAWFVVSLIFFIGFVLAGLAAWKQGPHAMYCQAQTFLPT